MNRFLLGFLLIFQALFLYGQEVQWASKVVDFSSELTPIQYSAEQILNKPNVLPNGGESPNAWTPSRANREEFITVGFETPIRIRQIAVAESYAPSTVKNIYTIDTRGREHLIRSFTPRELPLESGRMLNLIFDETPYEVASIKIEFDGTAVTDYYSIDAVGISASLRPVGAEINIPGNITEGLSTERLSDNVNSTYKEYKPLLSPDGQTLFFSRKNHPENVGGEDDNEDIWFSEKDENGEWKKAENMGEGLNNVGPNFVASVTPDGNSMLLLLGNKYKKNGKMEAGVSVAFKEGDGWSAPIPLEIENDYNYSDKANYFLTNNREVLLMSVERDDTQGGRDIYVSFLKPDSTWSEPKTIGVNVNTANDEVSPFLAADDQTLYFSSNGYAGFGGYDVYVTRRLDDTWLRWSDPENLGPVVNTPEEDLFFNIPVTGDYAYYSRGVTETDTDIHRIKLPMFFQPKPVVAVRGRLYNSKTNEPIEAIIFYESLPDGEEKGQAKSQHDSGEFELILPRGYLYGFRAEAEGYLPIEENIDLRDEAGQFEVVERDLFLVPVEKEVTIVMNNIFFDFDKATLRPESKPELDRITTFLKENQGIRIKVAGHTCSWGPEQYNLGLSERRAKAVQSYFVNEGVDGGRVGVEWHGEAKPSTSNDTLDGRKKNRRVEFTIVETE